MGFWSNLFSGNSGAGVRQRGLQIPVPLIYQSNSAAPVTQDTALQLSAVWACVRLISEAVASMPLNLYRVEGGVKTLATDHPLQRLFNGKVNRWQTRQEFFETLTYQLSLLGNAYSVIQRNGQGQIIGLIPLMSEQMEVGLEENGDVTYKYTDGSTVKFYAQSTIWHNKLFGNGVIGLSPLGYARNTIGVGSAVENRVTKIYSNGAKPAGMLMIDKMLTADQRARIKQNFNDMSEGSGEGLFVLEADMKYQQLSLSPKDIELLASRRFQIEDIARFFGIPSVLINDTAATTVWGSGVQQIVQGFYKFGLRPYLERFESSMKNWLLAPEERSLYEFEFDFNSLLKPDESERYRSYREAILAGFMTPNQARLREGWEPIAGGDVAYMQQQNLPLQELGLQNGQTGN